MKGFIEVHDTENELNLISVKHIVSAIANKRKILDGNTRIEDSSENVWTVTETYDEVKHLIEEATE